MAKFVTIGYGDEAGYRRTPEPLRDEAHRHDARLAREGAIMGIAGAPVQVRNTEGRGTETVEGPFLSASLPVAGFAIIEAASLEEAIRLVSGAPCAICHGVVEVWPLGESDD
jgi:hypothetical protein